MKFALLFLLTITIIVNAQSEVITTQKTFANKFGEKNIVEYQIKLADGSIAKFVKEFDYDVPFPSVNVLSDELILFANSLDASLELLNKSGDVVNKVYLSDKKIEYERSLYVSVFKNLVTTALTEPTENFTQFFIFDKELNLKAGSEKEAGLINGLLFSNDLVFQSRLNFENDIILKSIKITDLNFNKKLILQGNFSHYDISKDFNLVLLYDNQSAICFDLSEMKISAELKSVNNIVTAKLFEDSFFIVESDDVRYENMKWTFYNSAIKQYLLDTNQVKIIKTDLPAFTEYKWNKDKSILLGERKLSFE